MRGTAKIALGAMLLLLCATDAGAQTGCTGDCNDDSRVTVGELIIGVNISLERAPLGNCVAFDVNDDGRVSIGELIGGVRSSLDGCIEPSAFAPVQQIFTNNCAFPGCHNAGSLAGDMSLEEGMAYDDIVGVQPNNPFAADDGLLRVDPGSPENSYLLAKLQGNLDPLLGNAMPLFADPLSDSDIQLIRDWIAAGAEP